jgi:lactoylglutathione lyase
MLAPSVAADTSPQAVLEALSAGRPIIGSRMGGIPAGKTPTQMDIAMIELTHNWDEADYQGGRNFGHLAYAVPDIYALCSRLQDNGVDVLRPPRDGRMAFVRSPDGISVELLQAGEALPPQDPWLSMPNRGSW